MRSFLRLSLVLLLAAASLLFAPGEARAASCYVVAAQGSTGPATWETYCWLDFTSYVDATARGASGQNFSYSLADGSILSFNMKVTSSAAITAATVPSWSGAAMGNTAFTGIAGRPVLYQTAGGTVTVAMTGITLTPPPGASASSFMFVAGDGESTNDTESLRFVTNGGNWVLLDQVGPTSGSTYPTQSGAGTQTFTETGVAGTVGAYIVGSTIPTSVTTTLVGSGLQGAMFAVRFASIKLNMTINATRVDTADQFDFKITGTGNSTTYAAGSSSGTGLGPYTAASLSAMAAFPITLANTMRAGSTNASSHYRSVLTCTNSATGSSTSIPNNVVTSSYDFGSLAFGDAVSCNYNVTPYPHLMLTKALGAGGRQYNTDQFVMNVDQGATTVATTTTTGTGTTVTNAATPKTQVTAGTTYVFSESASGTTLLPQYTSGMACTNAWSASPTTLPTTVGGSITPQLGDVVSCTITNTKRGLNADLTTTKTASVVSDPANGNTNPKAIPGAVVSYAIQISNTGPGTTTSDSIFILDALPTTISVGTSATPTFAQGTPGSGLTFTAATDVRYSNAGSAPASFAACTYTPVSAYDPAVKYVCINPKGTMSASAGVPPNFTVSFNAQVK